MGLLSLYFNPAGRISRSRFWLGWLGLFVIELLFNFWMITSLFGRDPLELQTGALAKPALQLALLSNLIFLFPLFVLMTKRFHDRGKGATWSAPFLALSVGAIGSLLVQGDGSPQSAPLWMVGVMALYLLAFVWVIVELGFLRGEPGANRFGADPLGR